MRIVDIKSIFVTSSDAREATLVCDDEAETSLALHLNACEWRAFREIIGACQVLGEAPLSASTLAAIRDSLSVGPREVSWNDETRDEGGELIFLPIAGVGSKSFEEVLLERRSNRVYAELSENDLGAILLGCNQIRSSWRSPMGYSCTSRPSPSAGARHPLNVNVVVGKGLGACVPVGVYRYHPECHALLLRSAGSYCSVLDKVEAEHGSRPPVVLVFTAQIQRTLSRYPRGMSFIYLDAGALIGTHALAAAALGLAACPLAAPLLDPDFWECLCDSELPITGMALG